MRSERTRGAEAPLLHDISAISATGSIPGSSTIEHAVQRVFLALRITFRGHIRDVVRDQADVLFRRRVTDHRRGVQVTGRPPRCVHSVGFSKY